MFKSSATSQDDWTSLDKSDHSSRARSVVLMNGIWIALVAVVVLLRSFTKVFMARRLFVDDYLMISSSVFFFAFAALNLAAVPLGFGTHLWDLAGITAASTPAALSAAAAPAQRLNYVALVLVAPAIVLAKVSIIALLLRVFPPALRALRVFMAATAAAVVACCTSQALVVVFQCWPVQASWGAPGAGSCHLVASLERVAVGLGALNVATDLVVCATPIPYFWRLSLPRPQKICLCALFLSGLIACGISIVRVTSLHGLSESLDVTYASVPYFNWSVCETALIITTGSVPSLRPLMATIVPGLFRSHNFTTLFNLDERRGRPDSEWAAGGSSTQGTITITKEYLIVEMDKYPPPRRPDTASSRPATPATPKLGPSAICQRVDG